MGLYSFVAKNTLLGGIMHYYPEVHFENARELSVSKEDSHLRYCCLELRYCIEAIVYRKLSAFHDIPNAITETWQPHKAIRMLARIENGVVAN